MIDHLCSDLVHALRRLGRSPGAALVAIATLAIGIGATSAIFSVVDAVLLRPLSYRDPGRLVAVFAHEIPRGERRSPTSPADFLEWRRASRTLEGLTAAHPWSPVLRGRGHPEQLKALKATPGLFDLLGVAPALGHAFGAPDDEFQVVLGHALWQRRFGGVPGIVGQSLVLDGQPYRVAAVMPPGFRFPPFWTEAELWAPLAFDAEAEANHSRFLRVFGRLGAEATLEAAREEMDVVGERLAAAWPRSNADVRVNVEPLLEPVVGRSRPALLVLFGAVVLVLLIACANVSSLLLAQGFAREREAAVRAALGASRARLLGLRLAESVVLALVGGAAGLALAHVGVSALPQLGAVGLPRAEEIAVDARVVAFALGLSFLTGVVSGLVPALRTARLDLVPSLKQAERSVAEQGRHRLHDLLVVGQCAMAAMLLVGAGLLMRSFLELQHPDTGFAAEGLLTIDLSLSGSPRGEASRRAVFLRGLAEEVGVLPGVEGAAFVNHVPIGGDTWRVRFSIQGRPVPEPADVPQAVTRTTSPGYLSAMGIPLVRGRAFTESDGAEGAPVVLVNQTLARRFWPDGDPVGARLTLGRPDSDPTWRTVVGVMADARQSGPVDRVEPEVLFPYTQDPVAWFQGTTLVVRTGAEARAAAENVVARVRAAAPEVPIVRARTMPELLSEALTQERFGALLMALLSAVALALSLGGIYGVMAYTVGRRTREIGVRLALGARPGAVQAMFLKEGLRLGVTGASLGLLGALALSGLLRAQLHEISPADPATFASVGLLLLSATVAGALLPARRAAALDPASVLREA